MLAGAGDRAGVRRSRAELPPHDHVYRGAEAPSYPTLPAQEVGEVCSMMVTTQEKISWYR